MTTFSPARAQPITLDPSVEAQTYGLFALAMGLTVVGVLLGMQFAPRLLSTGMHFVFLFAELAILLTANLWMRRSPLNILFFGAFPVLSGLTITPYILYVLISYANGSAILLNAFGATACMGLAAAVFARTTRMNLGAIGRYLFFALVSLVFMGILQIVFPSLRGGPVEIFFSAGGILIMSLYTAYDLQRIQEYGRAGASPFMMALSLYMDIFNLFIYVLRFMVAISGRRD